MHRERGGGGKEGEQEEALQVNWGRKQKGRTSVLC